MQFPRWCGWISYFALKFRVWALFISLQYPFLPPPPSAASLNKMSLTCHFRAAERHAVEEAALAILIRQFPPTGGS